MRFLVLGEEEGDVEGDVAVDGEEEVPAFLCPHFVGFVVAGLVGRYWRSDRYRRKKNCLFS